MLLQTCSYKPAPTNLLLQTRSHKHAPTNRILQFYCSMHKLSPKHINQALHSPTHSHGSRHTCSHTQTGQGIHSPHTYRAKHTISYIHTEQGIHSPTYIQSKAHFQPHTYRARHTFNDKHSSMEVRGETGTVSQTFCHKRAATNILAEPYYSPQPPVTKVTRQSTYSIPSISPGSFCCRKRALFTRTGS